MKLFTKIMLLFLVFVLIAGCKKNSDTLYIYNWTYYTPDSVIKGFEEKFSVKVVYDQFAANEEMFTKLKAGATGYDITFPSGDYVSIMIKEGMLEKLDKTKIPNFKNIDPEVLSRVTFDKGNLYSVPYMMGASGISVNTDKVKNFKKDMSIFLMPELKGKMTLLDDMREVFGYALKDLGYSVNSVNLNELNQAKDLINRWKTNIQKFDAESFGKGFAQGEFWVVQGYEENVFPELEPDMKSKTQFFFPEKGGPMYIDSMVILKDSKNKELAYQFINYIHDPEIYASFVDDDKFLFPCINVPAREKRTKKPVYEISDLKNCELKNDLGSNIELYNKLWQEIRVGQ